jgi:hypothetical protein
LFIPGSLVLTRSVYTNGHNITAQVTNLPPGCTPISPSNPNPADPCALAVIDSAYPFVFNNDTVDGSFGITSKIFLVRIPLKWGTDSGELGQRRSGATLV